LVVGDDAVHRFADFRASLRVLQDFRAHLGQTKAARGAFQQSNSEFILEVCNPSADAGERHLQAARRLGEALCLHHGRENDQRVEVGHHHPNFEKLNSVIGL